MASFDRRNKVGFKELNPELAEYIRRTRIDLDNHRSNTTIHVTQEDKDKWNGYDSRITILEENGGDEPGTPVSTLSNLGSMFVGDYSFVYQQGTQGQETSSYYYVTSRGMRPDSGNYKKCVAEQTTIYSYTVPSNATELYITVTHVLPAYQLS